MSEHIPNGSAGSSRTATVAFWLGAGSIGLAILGVLGIQIGLLAPMGGFGLYQLANLCALLALILGAVGLLLTRRGGDHNGRRRALLATGCGAAMIALLVLAARSGAGLPPINDITTDLDSPPAFEAATRLPENEQRDMSYPPDFVEQVRTAYPDIEPIVLAQPSSVVFARAVQTARDLGWEVTYRDETSGHIEALDVTPVFQFVDDIAIRVQSTDSGAVVDVRSKSRDGRGDLGANAERIRAFTAALADASPVAAR